ncbi:hypothetical protein Aperf_G00000052638 [Anoplocephala perfoliata]
MAPILAYWNARGVTEHIRLLLHYLKVDYVDKSYNVGPPPELSREEWLAEKFKLGLDFPNLPYYIDGDFKLTQSSAIIEYIADKFDMLPTCKEERAIIHMLYNDIIDLRSSAAKAIIYPHTDEEEEKFRKGLPDKLKQYEQYLEGKQFLTGDKISYPDFALWEFLDRLKTIEPTSLQSFPKLTAYFSNFEKLPQLKEYLASDEFKNRK